MSTNYDQFRKQRSILKEKLLSDAISKIDVPNMLTEKSKPKSTSQQIKSNGKIVGIVQKKILNYVKVEIFLHAKYESMILFSQLIPCLMVI